MKFRNLLGLSIFIACSTLTGCTNLKSDQPKPGTISTQIEQQGEIFFLEVTDLKSFKKNQLLSVQTEISNSDTDNKQLYYRFKWTDANGVVIGTEESWKSLTVYGLQKQYINAVAPSPLATDFRLVLQSPVQYRGIIGEVFRAIGATFGLIFGVR